MSLVDELAERLAAAERERRAIPQLVHDHPELDVETAYEIQEALFTRRVAGGDRRIGYKLGLTSRVKQEAMGVSDPLWARLGASMLHAEEEPLRVDELIHPRAEPELVFLIGEDLQGPGVSVADALAATRGVLPGIEVLDSRYENFKFTLPDVVADNASAARVLVGGRMLPPDRLDLCLEGMVLRASGDVVATAAGAAVSGHPAAAVAWLANSCGLVEAGSLVFSGGMTAPVPLVPGGSVSAQFTNLGSVTLQAA